MCVNDLSLQISCVALVLPAWLFLFGRFPRLPTLDSASQCCRDLGLETGIPQDVVAVGRLTDLIQVLLIDRGLEQRPAGVTSATPGSAQAPVLFMRRNQRGRAALGIGPVARPLVLPCMANHVGSDRVAFDIAIAGQYIVFSLGEAGAEAAFPQCAAAPIGAVNVLHVALAQMLHQQCGAVLAFRRDQQMHVIGHEHIGRHGTTEAFGQFSQEIQIEAIIIIREEAHRAVVAALDDVPGDAGEAQAGSARHDGVLDGRAGRQVYQENVVCPLFTHALK